MIAQVAVYIYRVLDVIAVEGDSRLADRRYKLILHKAHVVVVDVDVGKHVLKHSVENLARLKQVVDTLLALSLYNVLLLLGVLAVDVLRNSLVYRHGKDELAVVGRCLYLVLNVRLVLELARSKVFGLDVVKGKRNLLILVVLIIVVVFEMGTLLGGNDTLHQLHCRIILARIAFALLLNHYLAERP